MEINFGYLRDSVVNNASLIAQEAATRARCMAQTGAQITSTLSDKLMVLVTKIKSLDIAVTLGSAGAFFKTTLGIVLGTFTGALILMKVAQTQKSQLVRLVLNVAGIATFAFGASVVLKPGIGFFAAARA